MVVTKCIMTTTKTTVVLAVMVIVTLRTVSDKGDDTKTTTMKIRVLTCTATPLLQPEQCPPATCLACLRSRNKIIRTESIITQSYADLLASNTSALQHLLHASLNRRSRDME